MSRLLRELLLLALAGLGSWWLLVRTPQRPMPAEVPPLQPSAAMLPLEVRPRVRADRPVPTQTSPAAGLEAHAQAAAPAAAEEAAPQAAAAAATPPPAERGAPEGEAGSTATGSSAEDQQASVPDQADPEPATRAPGEADAAAEAEPRPVTQTEGVQQAMADATLIERAEQELGGALRKGFETVLLAAPEDQVDIARFFGEELVLVPRSALDPANERPSYFRLDPLSLELQQIAGRPQLERHRQYRDLFDYEYRRLPERLRALRRAHINRAEIYLFAALISAREWALAIARREAALAAAPDPDKPVRRFELRYQRLAGDAFDLQVERIVFADGSSSRPPMNTH